MLIKTGAVYQAFKYSIYALLAVNTGHFFFENLAGAAFTHRDGLAPGDIIVAYTDAIDTAAWLVLLVLLELKTRVISDAKLKGWLDLLIGGLSFFCWIAILYAFYGYVATLGVPYGFAPYGGPDPCNLVGEGASFAKSLADYTPLDTNNCMALASGAYYSAGDTMFTTSENLSLIKRLAWTDVVNAGTWVVIVVILELEIYLGSSRLFGTKVFFAYKTFKLLLYGVLLVNTLYWRMLGEPWAAWDALLWLAAFFFIEMNVLSRQEENAKLRAVGAVE